MTACVSRCATSVLACCSPLPPHLLPAAGALPGPCDDGLHPSLIWAVPAKVSCFPPAPGVGVGTRLPCLP